MIVHRSARAALLAAALLSAAHAPAVAAQGPAQATLPPAPPLPATGVDFTGIDAFYHIADLLIADREPSDPEWAAFLATPGYRLLWQQRRDIRRQMATAFRPSLHAARDSVLQRNSDDALALRHLIRAVDQRQAVLETERALQRSMADSVALGVRGAARFLPAGTVDRQAPPFIAFAVFADDGYALDGGILLDPLYVNENGLVPLISHEFHHAYTISLDRTIRPTGAPPADVQLALAVMHLRTEGIADQIDKPHPLPPRDGPLAAYVSRYNETYARTPAILVTLDSLLAAVHDDPRLAPQLGARARALLWSNSHPNGAYMAREILETFGVDSLMPSIANPFAFVRAYAAAEAKRGSPPPFSAKAMATLDDMEKRYLRP